MKRSEEIKQQFLEENQNHEQLTAALKASESRLSELRGQYNEARKWETEGFEFNTLEEAVENAEKEGKANA